VLSRCANLGAGPGNKQMDEALRTKILQVLQSQHLMTLATIRPDGYPQATIVNYISDDLTLYFATDAASQKVGNIRLNNKVSIAIANQTEDFYKLSGLSMSGLAMRILDQETADQLSIRLFRKLPQSKRFVPQDPRQLAVFSVTPVAIAIIDYASGFGTSHLLEL
jgi:general stress protein 26